MGMGILKSGQHQTPLNIDNLSVVVDILGHVIVIPDSEDTAVIIDHHRAGPWLLRIDGINLGVVQQQGGGFIGHDQAAAEQQHQRQRA
jgi:hypothetical protein